jgi:dihydropteroate synthase
MVQEGADMIDVGGESTRPKGEAYGEGADSVGTSEELRRVIPVIERLSSLTDVPISIDTYKAEVAADALDAGATIVNDISGLTFDPQMAQTAGERGASVVLMHIKGRPKTMQLNPVYTDLFGEILSFLRSSIEKATAYGVSQVFVDPGIGFGKTRDHNLQLLNGLHYFAQLGYPILVGPSRKAFIGSILDLPVDDRLEGTLAACVAAILRGASIIRVHDVKEAKRAAMIADAVKTASV